MTRPLFLVLMLCAVNGWTEDVPLRNPYLIDGKYIPWGCANEDEESIPCPEERTEKRMEAEQKKKSEAKCLKNGGHCWNVIPSNVMVLTNPPRPGPTFRVCRHCGKKQMQKPPRIDAEEWVDQ